MTRRYWIRLRGHDGHEVLAPNASKAKAADYAAWVNAGYGLSPWRSGGASKFRQYLSQVEAVHALGEVRGEAKARS
jgi:hypothetical protein